MWKWIWGILFCIVLSGCGGNEDIEMMLEKDIQRGEEMLKELDNGIPQNKEFREEAKEIYDILKDRMSNNQLLTEYEYDIFSEFNSKYAEEDLNVDDATIRVSFALLLLKYHDHVDAVNNKDAPMDNKYKREIDEQLEHLALYFDEK